MRSISLLTLTLLASSVSAYAQETPQPAPTPAEKLVCKSVALTGSRMGRKKVCMTKAQAKAEEDSARREVPRGGQAGY